MSGLLSEVETTIAPMGYGKAGSWSSHAQQSIAVAGDAEHLYIARTHGADGVPADGGPGSFYEIRVLNCATGDWLLHRGELPTAEPGTGEMSSWDCRLLCYLDADQVRAAVDVLFVRGEQRLCLRSLDQGQLFEPVAPMPPEYDIPLQHAKCLFAGSQMRFGLKMVGDRLRGISDLASPTRQDWLVPLQSLLKAEAEVTGALLVGDALYAAVRDCARGFELWQAALGEQPRWRRLLERGAFRHAQNQDILAMAEQAGSLVLATGTPAAWRQPESKFFDYQGFELIRVDASADWELIAGAPRFSPTGLKLPSSALGPGMGACVDRELYLLREHAGRLLLLTADDQGIRLWHSCTGRVWSSEQSTAWQGFLTLVEGELVSCGDDAMLILETANLEHEREMSVWRLRLED